jgi:hypothetical protein
MGPIRLAANLTYDELQQSAVARNALILLLAASSGAGLKDSASDGGANHRRQRDG